MQALAGSDVHRLAIGESAHEDAATMEIRA